MDESEPPRYVLRANADRVDLWCSARLPFDGKGWKREMRDALGAGLREMAAEPGRVLHAVYAAPDDGQFSDVENVLFYNVGSQHFRHLMLTGVRFERAYAALRSPVQLAGTERHHHTYALADPSDGFIHWTGGETLATLRTIHISSIAKAGQVWAAIRSQADPPCRTAAGPTRFVVRLELTRPPTWPGPNRSAADVIKTVLDGVVAAFHSHVGPAVPDPAQAKHGGLGDLVNLARHLADERWAALGARRLWWPLGEKSVQWNPADDYCVAAEIILAPTLTSGGWTLSGSLHRATSSPPRATAELKE